MFSHLKWMSLYGYLIKVGVGRLFKLCRPPITLGYRSTIKSQLYLALFLFMVNEQHINQVKNNLKLQKSSFRERLR